MRAAPLVGGGAGKRSKGACKGKRSVDVSFPGTSFFSLLPLPLCYWLFPPLTVSARRVRCFSCLMLLFFLAFVSCFPSFFFASSFVVVVLSRLCEFRAGFIDAFPTCLLFSQLLGKVSLAFPFSCFSFCEFSTFFFFLLFYFALLARKTFKLPQIEKCQQSLKCVWGMCARGRGTAGGQRREGAVWETFSFMCRKRTQNRLKEIINRLCDLNWVSCSRKRERMEGQKKPESMQQFFIWIFLM